MNPRKRLRIAIESFLFNYPMFANIVLKWELVEVTDRPTMATNGKQLLYNPDFVTENTHAENAWIILHEAGHVFLGHHLRLIGKVLGLANIAFDLALNELIREACPSERLRRMLVFVGKGDYADFPHGRRAEVYYDRLENPGSPESTQGEPESDGCDGDTSNESGSSQDNPGENGEQPEDASDTSNASGQGDEGNGPGSDSDSQGAPSEGSGGKNASKAGSGANKGHPGEIPGSDYTGLGEVLPMPDVDTPAEKAKAEGEWQEVVAESLALGKMCGNCPGWFKSKAEELLGKSEISWKQVLRQFLTKTSKGGYSYARPSRRSSYRRDIVLPANRSRRSGDGAIIADTSGSIFAIIRDKVLPEANMILSSVPNPSVRLVQIDTQVTSDRTYGKWDFPLTLDVKGGGGTDLNPALKVVSRDRNLKWLVIVTDMIWAWPQAFNPGVPTLWLIVGNDSFRGKVPFGRLVKVK
jgi:predicted metal-dependent peptidase